MDSIREKEAKPARNYLAAELKEMNLTWGDADHAVQDRDRHFVLLKEMECYKTSPM